MRLEHFRVGEVNVIGGDKWDIFLKREIDLGTVVPSDAVPMTIDAQLNG